MIALNNPSTLLGFRNVTKSEYYEIKSSFDRYRNQISINSRILIFNQSCNESHSIKFKVKNVPKIKLSFVFFNDGYDQ